MMKPVYGFLIMDQNEDCWLISCNNLKDSKLVLDEIPDICSPLEIVTLYHFASVNPAKSYIDSGATLALLNASGEKELCRINMITKRIISLSS